MDVKGAQTLKTTTGYRSNMTKVSMKQMSKIYGNVEMTVEKSDKAAGRVGLEDSGVDSMVLPLQSRPI